MWLRAYRLLVLLTIAWLIRNHHAALLQRTLPVSAKEVGELLPEAASLRKDDSPRGGYFVDDKAGVVVGYAACTMPRSKDIIGYAGTTDALIVLDESWRVLGVRIRSSEETQRYVAEVAQDLRFLKSWTGMSAGKASLLQLGRQGFDAVAGASATCRAVARAVARTLADVSNRPREASTLRFAWSDAALLAIVMGGCFLAFGKTAGRRRLRLAFQVVVFAYFLSFAADMVTMKMTVGWLKAGIPWQSAPGLVALLAVAVLLPWGTQKPVYCVQICPHGAAQEWLGALAPKRLRVELSAKVQTALKILPLVLLVVSVVGAVVGLELDLAEIEPFDGYNLVRQTVGFSTLAIAIVGLVAACYVPKAYCKYGCPTGLLLEYSRARGPDDRFALRDWIALGLLLAVAGLCRIP